MIIGDFMATPLHTGVGATYMIEYRFHTGDDHYTQTKLLGLFDFVQSSSVGRFSMAGRRIYAWGIKADSLEGLIKSYQLGLRLRLSV